MLQLPSFTPLREFNFRWYFWGRSLSTFGSSFGLLALTFGILRAGGGARDLGLVLGISAVPTLVLVLFGGVVSDRFDRRRILLTTDVLMGVLQLATSIVFASGHYNILILCLLQTLRGASMGFFNPASTGYLPQLVSPNELQSANALLSVTKNASQIVATATAGLLLTVTSPAVALAFDGTTFLLSAMFLSRLSSDRDSMQLDTNFTADLRDGFREFTSRSWVWQMVGSFCIYQATILPTVYVIGPLVLTRGGLDPSGWAFVLSIRAAGSLIGGFVCSSWRPRRPLQASSLLILLDVPFLLLLVSDEPLTVVAAAAALSAAGMVASNVLWESTLQQGVPSDSLSRVSSYDWLGSLAMNPIGMFIIGTSAAHQPVSVVVLWVAALHIVIHLILAVSPPIRLTQQALSHEGDVEPATAG